MKKQMVILFVLWVVLSVVIIVGLILPDYPYGNGPNANLAPLAGMFGVFLAFGETLVLGTGLAAFAIANWKIFPLWLRLLALTPLSVFILAIVLLRPSCQEPLQKQASSFLANFICNR